MILQNLVADIAHSGLVNRHAGHHFCFLMDPAAHNLNNFLSLIQRHIADDLLRFLSRCDRIIHICEDTMFSLRGIIDAHLRHDFTNDALYHAFINWHDETLLQLNFSRMISF